MRYDARREERIKSVKYFLNTFGSVLCILVTNSRAVSAGQFCEGRKTESMNVEASCPLVVTIACKRWQISCRAYCKVRSIQIL